MEKENSKQKEKISDLEQAKELLLNSKVELQHQLESSQGDVKSSQLQIQQLNKEKEQLCQTYSREKVRKKLLTNFTKEKKIKFFFVKLKSGYNIIKLQHHIRIKSVQLSQTFSREKLK